MLLPYYGGYAADFWNGGTTWDDNNGVYLFNSIGDETNGGPYPALQVSTVAAVGVAEGCSIINSCMHGPLRRSSWGVA
jgi:hypothetical protein